MLSRLAEDEQDVSDYGEASLWVCIKGSWAPEGTPAVWKRVMFDGVATCKRPVQNHPITHNFQCIA
jgi:hypothetical protein